MPGYPLTPPRTLPYRVDVTQVKTAARLVDTSGVVERIDTWRTEDGYRPERGGRRPYLNERQILILMVILLRLGEPLHLTKATNIIAVAMTDNARTELGLPTLVQAHRVGDNYIHGYANWYKRVQRSWKRLLRVVDPYPEMTYARALTCAEYEELTKGRDPEFIQRRRDRATELWNRLITATHTELPEEAWSHWEGDVTGDGTPIDAARRGNPGSKRWAAHRRMSSEPDAGWYRPEGDHVGDGPGGTQRWAYEATLMFAGIVQSGEYGVPSLVVGMSLDKPGHKPAINYLNALRYFTTTELGQRRRYAVGDRAYPAGSKVENYHRPLRELGYGIVGDYRIDQLGKQVDFAGALMIEGGWYCPSTPQNLIDATLRFRGAKGYDPIDEDEYRKLIEQRKAYRLRRKQGTPNGQAMMCPARGPGKTKNCTLLGIPAPIPGKDQPAPIRRSRPAGRVCSNKDSLMIPSIEGEKFRQDGPDYQTPEWGHIYGTLRNVCEGSNSNIKNLSASIGNRTRRLVRGFAAHWAMMALGVIASNLDKISSYLDRVEANTPIKSPDPDPTPPDGGRRTRPEPDVVPVEQPDWNPKRRPGAPPLAA